MSAPSVAEILAKLTPAQLIEARELLGPLCLWCGGPGTQLCDARIAYLTTCDAAMCPQCASSVHYTGCTLAGGPPHGTFDTCPACVERKAAGERCDQRPPVDHHAMVREHAARAIP